MLTILAFLLCFAIIASAVTADRSARANHKFRAVLLNLCGIGCLAVGLLVIFAWSRGGVVVPMHMAMAQSAGNPGTLVRLMVTNDNRSDRAKREKPEARRDAESRDGVKPEAEAADPHFGDNQDDKETRATLDDPLLEQLDEALDDTGERDDGLPIELRSQVEINYEARPAWVERPEGDVGDVHQISVTAGPFQRLRNARKELYNQLKTTTDEYIDDVVGNPHASRWIGFDEARIRRTLVSSDNYYDEKVISPSFGVMYQSHALLEFGPAFHEEVEQAWHQVVARTRLIAVTLAGGTVLGLLALLFGYFTADTATKGFYTRRLKFVTTVAILGLIVGGILLARSIPWLWL